MANDASNLSSPSAPSRVAPAAGAPGDSAGDAAGEKVRGACQVLFAFDVGFAINLNEAEKAIAANSRRAVIQKKKRAPQSVHGPAVPLSVSVMTEPLDVLGFAVASNVEIVLYSFAAASVRFTYAIDHSLDDLVALSDALYDHAALAQRAREHVERLLAALGSSIAKPRIAPPFEDYVVFEIAGPVEESVEAFVGRHAGTVARILRAEREPLSRQEMEDALTQSIGYGSLDRAVIDWHAALLIGPDAADVRFILEYANVQLVQMRSLDDELERLLDATYELLARFKGFRQTFLGLRGGELRRLGTLHADSAIMFEAATHSMKLVGDQYLARVYRAASARFHLPQWGANINRKLQTIDTIYEKMTHRQATVRLELLEWIIVILILIEVIKGFWPTG